MKNILKINNINKHFSGIKVLTNVSLEVNQKQIHGVVGKNGAGKSTLMNIIMGIINADEGIIHFDNKEIREANPLKMIELGITLVPQKLKMLNTLSVAENLFCGNLPKNRFRFVNWNYVYKKANLILEKMGLNIDSSISVQELNVEQKTMLSISKAVFHESKLIILDEPTAILNKKETNILFDFIKKQKDKNISFIYISHQLEEIFEICDKVLVLVDGHSKGSYSVNDLNISKLVNLMIGKNLNSYKRKNYCDKTSNVFSVKNLTRRGFYQNITFNICQGEILGICGLGSSGLNELIHGIYGLERKGIGDVCINEKHLHNINPKKSIDNGIVYLTNDRHEDGLINFRPLKENISISILKFISKLSIVNNYKENNIAKEKVNELKIIPSDINKEIDLFSGGNQQKIIFGRLAVTVPKLMLLHEPVQGVDVNSKNDIFETIEKFASSNISILIASTEIRELINVCDRIIVMYQNKIVYEVNHQKFDFKKIMLTMEQGI